MTTDSPNHSGEGIFFTSRMLDKFALISDKKLFSHDKYFDISGDIDISQFKVNNKGTTVCMELSNFSKRTLKEVFDMFSNQNEDFIKTTIPLNVCDEVQTMINHVKNS